MDALRFLKDWKSEKGAELVEFALTFPLLLLVCLGIIDFGLLFQQYQVINNAAREGARVAVLGFAEVDVQTRVGQYLLGTGLTPASATTTMGAATLVNVGGTCMTVIPVTVTYPHQYIFISGIGGYFGQTFGTKTLTAVASMRREIAGVPCP
jgi:hypothetical protein